MDNTKRTANVDQVVLGGEWALRVIHLVRTRSMGSEESLILVSLSPLSPSSLLSSSSSLSPLSPLSPLSSSSPHPFVSMRKHHLTRLLRIAHTFTPSLFPPVNTRQIIFAVRHFLKIFDSEGVTGSKRLKN